MNALTKLKNVKLITQTQVDLSLISSLYDKIANNIPVEYFILLEDVQFINQIGTQLFNHFNQKESKVQKVWYQSLDLSLTTAIDDTNKLISIIPVDSPYLEDFKAIALALIDDFNVIKSVLST